MPKMQLNIYDLVESDFREIQYLVTKKTGVAYSVGYIRKVCKGQRHNTNIKAMAVKYLDVKKEMKSKFERLSK